MFSFLLHIIISTDYMTADMLEHTDFIYTCI